MAGSEDLDKLFGDRKIPKRVMFKRLAKYLKPEWMYFLIASILVILNVGCNIILPLIAKEITKTLEEAGSHEFWSILVFVIASLVITVLGQLFLYIQSMTLQKSGQRIVYRLRMEVFTHIKIPSL